MATDDLKQVAEPELLPELVEDALERMERRVYRLRKFIELRAPRMIIEHEVRMCAYGAHQISSALDDSEEPICIVKPKEQCHGRQTVTDD